MTELAVITPSFRGDADIFADLHRSVLEFTSSETVHHVIVPQRDRQLFAQYEGARCRILTSSELLPSRFVHIGRGDSFVNARRPWPPVRGWVMQQALKIAAAAEINAEIVLIADSDVVLVRPVRAGRFVVGGQHLIYREDGGVTAEMERHVIWHRVARELFGLPAAPPLPLPDYVSSFNFWQPTVVRAMQQRIGDTTGRNWLDAFTSQLHISEFMMYGIFVDEVLGGSSSLAPADTSVCHNTWQRTPLDHAGGIAFADELGPDAVAMMISAKSRTPIEIRRAAIERCAGIVKAGAADGRSGDQDVRDDSVLGQ